MSRPASTNYVKFTAREQVVVFKTDRGQLRTNDMGDFFFRELTDGRFTCASPELERQLIDAGYRAGQQVGITRTQYGHSVIWKVRRVGGEAIEMPRPHEPTRKPAPPAEHEPFPAEKYATPQPPAPVWPEVEPVPAHFVTEAPAPAVAATTAADGEISTASAVGDSYTKRFLKEAIDLAGYASEYAKSKGLEIHFDNEDVRTIFNTLTIRYCEDQATVSRMIARTARKPPAKQGWINGAAKTSEVRQ